MSTGVLDRAAALAQLTSTNPHNRYLAAKSLSNNGDSNDLSDLMKARRAETDNTTRRWLDYAIKACAKRVKQQTQDLGPVEPIIDSEMMQSIRAQAVEWVAGVLLHEIGSKIGLLSAAARKEITTYEGSETAKQLVNLELIFEGVLELRKAASAPQVTEFDLSELIESITAIETNSNDVYVSLVGRKPLLLVSDCNLLRLALCNGIRNAVESVRALSIPVDHSIVINWEITDTEFWISVIDQGQGLVTAGDAAFEIGRTSKTGHAGFGLAIARQAMEKLNGSVTLSSSTAGGVVYEIKGKIIK